MTPYFSITIPAFKTTFLDEAITSILNQTYTNFKLIIVDDASPQDIAGVVAKYTDDKRIRYYRNAQGFGGYNVVGNWNKCLEYAQGKYFICLGDDDRLLPHCLKSYVDLIELYPKLAVYHTLPEDIDETGKVIRNSLSREQRESIHQLLQNFLSMKTMQYIGDFLFETESLKKKGGFVSLPWGWVADNVSVAVAARETGIANTTEPGFQYRFNRQSISRNKEISEKKHAAIHTAVKIFADILEDEPQQYEDNKIREQCINELETYRIKYSCVVIRQDLRANPFRAIGWLRKTKEDRAVNREIFRLIFHDVDL